MKRADENRRSSFVAVWASLGAAAVFDALTVLATQDKTVRAASPWQEDPYDAVVSLGQVAVPMLAVVIALRLLAWRVPGGPDRAQQTVRAAGAMTTLIGLSLAFEWAAIIRGANASTWGAWTSVLIGGLVVTSLLTAAVIVLLVRCRQPRGSSGPWRHDWLGDVVLLCQRIPVLRHWAGPDAAAWVRRRAMTVFVTLSLLAAAAITAAQAIGEHWTNPLLIAWLLIVQATSYLAFCVVTNAVAGFIVRPTRTRRRHAVETAVVAGGIAIHVAVAFRDAVWAALGMGPLTSVPALAAFTLGVGLATSAVTAGLLLARTARPKPPDPDGTSALPQPHL